MTLSGRLLPPVQTYGEQREQAFRLGVSTYGCFPKPPQVQTLGPFSYALEEQTLDNLAKRTDIMDVYDDLAILASVWGAKQHTVQELI
jgi:hypothetical protein